MYILVTILNIEKVAKAKDVLKNFFCILYKDHTDSLLQL